MAIRNNKDFLKEYKDDAWKGFSTRELLCIIGAAAIGITVDALLHYYAGIRKETGTAKEKRAKTEGKQKKDGGN